MVSESDKCEYAIPLRVAKIVHGIFSVKYRRDKTVFDRLLLARQIDITDSCEADLPLGLLWCHASTQNMPILNRI